MLQQEVKLRGVFNEESPDIGGPSVSFKGHLDLEKTMNDKYSFYSSRGIRLTQLRTDKSS